MLTALEDCRIEVPQDAVDALRKTIPVSRDEAMRWVDPSFEDVARRAYISVGSPSLSNMSTGWSTFSAMDNGSSNYFVKIHTTPTYDYNVAFKLHSDR